MGYRDIPYLRQSDRRLIENGLFTGLGAVALIENEEGKLLLHLRDNLDWIAHPNLWAFIGGVVEDGEDVETAVLREVEEEVGLIASNPKPIFRLVDVEGSNNLISVFRVSTNLSIEELTLNEGQDFGFFTLDELGEMPLVPFAKDLIERLMA